MKAIELVSFSRDGLHHVDRNMPPAPGEGELLVQIEAAALNYRDIEIAQGRYGMPVSLPLVPMSDAVGIVRETGKGVNGFRAGDRVNPQFFPDWRSGPFEAGYFSRQLGGTIDGVLQEFMIIPALSAVHAPRHLAAEAAALPVAALTAWSALTEARVLPGQTVLLIGTGGVSLAALQTARMFGAETIVVSSSDSRLEQARLHGAAHGINYREHPCWSEQVMEITRGRGADVVVETGGEKTLPQSVRSLRTGGRIAVVGYVTGARFDIDLREVFIGKRAQLLGHTVGSGSQFEAMNRAFEASGAVPVIDSRFALHDARAAYERMASGTAFGKVLVMLA